MAAEQPVQIPVRGGVVLQGDLAVPDGAAGVVVFAHGSGSSRHSPRNRAVAEAIRAQGLGTLLMDLLTEEEAALDARTASLRFDIELLADRLTDTVAWLEGGPSTGGAPIGYFGASTGAAAALTAAARRPAGVAAVVSRGGRPDLAGGHLAEVRAPTLLVVGELDHAVVELNEAAARQLAVEHRLDVVPGATHLFEEPGALEQVANRAGDWFAHHLTAHQPTTPRRT